MSLQSIKLKYRRKMALLTISTLLICIVGGVAIAVLGDILGVQNKMTIAFLSFLYGMGTSLFYHKRQLLILNVYEILEIEELKRKEKDDK